MERPRTLVLAMGNDILGDDGVGLFAARRLRTGRNVERVESAEAGLALLEYLEGYEQVVILDAIKTGQHPVGSILRFTTDDFRTIVAPSPHYAGLPEVLSLGQRLGVSLPERILVIAMEVEDPYHIREGLSPAVSDALPGYIAEVEHILEDWAMKDIAPAV